MHSTVISPLRNFNSHAHVERDLIFLSRIFVINISTHTLTWSVTIYLILFSVISIISTHTLTWSVTSYTAKGGTIHTHFNSHAHVERDSAYGQQGYHLGYFNSHAHVERDLNAGNITFRRHHFNSHAHVERDQGGTKMKHYKIISTHTLTWSVTQRWCHA